MNFCTVIIPRVQNALRKLMLFGAVLLLAIAIQLALPGLNAPAQAATGAQYYTYSVSVENHNGYAYLSGATNLPNIGYNDWIGLFDHSPQNASDLQSGVLKNCWYWAVRKSFYQTNCPWQSGLYAVYVGKRQTSSGFDYIKLAEVGSTGGSCD